MQKSWISEVKSFYEKAIKVETSGPKSIKDYALRASVCGLELAQLAKDDLRSLAQSFIARKSPEAETLWRDGIVIIPNYMPPEQCDRLKDRLAELIKDRTTSSNLPGGAELTIRNEKRKRTWDTGMIDIRYIEKEIPEILNFRDDPFVAQIISDAEGVPFRATRTHAYINKYVHDTRIYHVDMPVPKVYKSFVYLTDVANTTFGPYAFVKGSHQLSPFRYLNRFVSNFSDKLSIWDTPLYNHNKEIACVAAKGTLIISTQNGSHRGFPQQPGRERYLLTTVYERQKK